MQDPVGILSTRPFCVPLFFDYKKQPPFSLRDLPRVPIGRFKQLLMGEERVCEGETLVAQLIKNLPAMQETPVQFLGREDALEKR